VNNHPGAGSSTAEPDAEAAQRQRAEALVTKVDAFRGAGDPGATTDLVAPMVGTLALATGFALPRNGYMKLSLH